MDKGWKRFTAGFVALFLFIVIASVFIDEPLRGYLERKINHSLKGYTVRIERVHFHPIGFALELENLVLARNERMDLPVVTIPRWRASLQWKALLFGRLVNDQYIEHPTFRITRMLARQEAKDEVSVADRGWQDAVESIYPFKINEVMIADAPRTDTVQVVLRLIQNAFFKAILPGFEREFHSLQAKSE